MSPTRRRITSSAAYLVLGMVALLLVTAILSAAVSSTRASHTADTLATQLADANVRLDQLGADNAATHAQLSDALAQLDQQRHAYQAQHAQLTAIVRYLKKQGIKVPKTAFAPRNTGTGPVVTVPKVPGPASRPPRSPHPSPGSPGPTATPSPSRSATGIDLSPVCQLLGLNPCPLS